MERSVPLKEEFIAYISQETGPHCAMQGHSGSTRFWSVNKSSKGKAKGRAWVSLRRIRQARANGL